MSMGFYQSLKEGTSGLTQDQQVILLTCTSVAAPNGDGIRSLETPSALEEAMGWSPGLIWSTLENMQEQGKLALLEWVQETRAIRFKLP